MILVLSLTSVFSMFAGDWYKLTSFNFKVTDGEWSRWEDINPGIEMYFEPETKRIEINSRNTQIIDFNVLTKTVYPDRTTLGGYATDTNYNNIYIMITTYFTGTEFLYIAYSDYQYMYVVKKFKSY